MQREEYDFVSRVSFEELTPEMLIGQKKPDIIYEKAFLLSKDAVCSEYGKNTSCWD